MRLFIISVLTVAAVFIGLITLRFYGGLKSYQPYDHKLLNSISKPWIIYSPKDLAEVATSNESWIALRVFITNSGKAIVLNYQKFKELEKLGFPKAWLNSEVPNQPELENLLIQNPDKSFLLLIVNNEENTDLILKAVLTRTNSLDKVIVDSEFDVIPESTKKQIPRVVFGTGIGEKSRLKLLEGLGLESIAPVNGDVFFSPIKKNRFLLMNSGVRNELKHRFIFWIADLDSTSETAHYLALDPDGWMTDRPEELRKTLLAH